MANATIKITQLPSIGNGLTASTILPVVDTTGTAITAKVSVNNLANFILTEAGNTLEPAFLSTVAYSVANAAQPNITSLGTLTGLAINSVNNLTVPGGNNGYVLQTDGEGNLSWAAGGGSGNGEVGGANSQIQFNSAGNFGGDPDLTWDAGNNKLITANFAATTAIISGNVNAVNLNASGNVKPNAIYTDNYYYANGYVFGGGGGNGTPGGSNTQIQFNDAGAFAGNTGFTFNKTTGIFTSPFLAGNGNGLSNIQGANVSGAVGLSTFAGTANAVAGANVSGAVTFAGTANSVAVANVVGIGNIATVALNGNGSQVLLGNGTWGNATGSTGDLGFISNAMYGLDGVIVENADLSHGATSALILPINGNSAAPVQLTNTYGNIVVTTGINSGQLKNWTFDNAGNLTLPGNTIAINYANGAQVSIGGGNASALVNGDNSFVLDGDGNVVFEGNVAGQAVDRGLVWDYGANANGVNSMVRQDNNGITVRAWTEQGGGANGYSAPVNIVTNQDATTKTWTFDGSGNLTLPGNLNIPTGNIVSNIVTPAFNSAITGINSGNANVIITIASELFEGPASGQVTISGVNPPVQVNDTWYYEAVEIDQFQLYTDANLTTPVDGSSWPGYVDGGTAVGIGAYGDLAVQGGNIDISSNDNTWTFDTTGNLTLPANTFAVNYANGTPVSISGGNTGNVTFDNNIVIGTGDEFGGGGLYLAPGNGSIANSAVQYLRVRGGDYPTHIHLDTGNNQYYDQYFGADSRYVKLEANGNIVINADDYAGNSSTWNFDINGNLTVPGNIQTITTGFPFTSTITGINTGSPTVIVTLTDSVFGAPETGRVTISGVVGTTEANDTWYFSSIDPSNFVLYYDQALQNPVDGTSWTTYISGGLAVAAGYSNISITGGNVTIVTNTSNTWTFTDDGNLILGGGNSVIQSIASSSLDPVNPNVSTMVFTPDPGYSTQALVLDPTAPGHIHLRAPGANIDEPSANIFLGGEDSSFEVGYYNGAAPNLFIHSNTNTWTFDNTGNLNLPVGGNLNFNLGGITQTINQEFNIVVQDQEDDGWSIFNTITDGLGNNLSQTQLDSGSFTIGTASGGNTYSWSFEGNTLQVSTNSQIRSFGSNIALQAMSSGSGGTASLQSVSNTNDPNIFTTFDATTTGANIVVYNGGSNGGTGYTWSFANDGRLTFPGTPRIDTDANNFEVQAAEAINFEANTVVNIYTDTGNTTYQWQFGDDGVLTVPGNLVYIGASPAPSISGFNSVSAEEFTNDTSNVTINANSNTWNFDSTGNLTIPSTSGGFIKTASNASIGIVAMDNGTNNPAQLLSMNVGNGNATSIVSAYSTNVAIQTNASGAINTWKFDNAGNLTLPANTFAINYANGTQVTLGGGNISNISNGTSSVNIATANGNVVTNINGSAILTTYSGGIKVGGSGILQSPGGASAMTLNNNGANIPIANITNTLNVTGAGGGNITANLTAGNISTGGTLTSTGKFGYASGSTVTQITSRGTGVTINTLAGTIVTTSVTMVANEIDTFSVINSSVDPNNDIVLAQIVSPNQGTYNCVANPALIGGFSNGFYINIVNISGFTTSNEALTIRFMVIKAPNA